MIKVFLVEDEVIMRNGIRRNIHWEEEGFTFAGEASDGELAWPLIKKCRPDILITDIRMPFMDGLELSALVRRELPDTKIIILSGYGEFDYAKRAITLGVTEYLLKPISSEKLLEAVKRVADIVRKERAQRKLVEQYQSEMQESIQLEKKHLFDRMILHTGSTSELLAQGQALGLDLTAAYYRVLLFQLLTPENTAVYSGDLGRAVERIETEVSKFPHIIVFERGLEGLAFLLKAESQELAVQETEELQECLTGILKEFQDIRFFGGSGGIVQRMRDIGTAYHTANKAFSSRFFLEQNQFISADDMGQTNLEPKGDMSLQSVDSSKINRKLVENFLKSGVEEEVDGFVEKYLENIGEGNYRSMMFCHYLIVDMNFCACHFLESLGIDTSLLSSECMDVNQFSHYANSREGMVSYVKHLFGETIRLRDRNVRNNYRNVIGAAKDYIMKNFQNNEISMNQVAAMVNISPSYFSTLFRQETGTTFIEYLTEVRLEKAKELLMCTDMRSSEIGYQVGYKDSHYFSYIFKKACGCTPKEYRLRKNEGGV